MGCWFRVGCEWGVMQRLREGAIVSGVVKKLTSYGAFVGLGSVDGLLLLHNMTWKRIEHPSDMFAVGQTIEVVVLRVNAERGGVVLGHKQLTLDPWEGAERRYAVGSWVTGRVVSLIDYGAFVELEEDVEGLIHVSEMGLSEQGAHPNTILSVGDDVECVVLHVDAQTRKLVLRLR